MNSKHAGFSLMEVLVGISILGIITLAITSMTTSAFKSTKSSKIRLDIQDVKRALTQSLNCPATFGSYGAARPIPCPTIASGTNVVLKKKDGSNILPTSGKLADWDIDARCENLGGQIGLSIYATKKKPGGGYQKDPLNSNLMLDESSPVSLLYAPGVRPCGSYFSGSPVLTNCPAGQYLAGVDFEDRTFTCLPIAVAIPACNAYQALSWDGARFYCTTKAPPTPVCNLNEDLTWNGTYHYCRPNLAAQCLSLSGLDVSVSPSWAGIGHICQAMADTRCARVSGCTKNYAQVNNVGGVESQCEWFCKTASP